MIFKIRPLIIQKHVKPHSNTETIFQHLPGEDHAGRAGGADGTGTHEPVMLEEENVAGVCASGPELTFQV